MPEKRRSPRARPAVQTGKVKPADPFELIRWLAHCQTDPRKAIAELVQNSLDAGAQNVRIERRRERGAGVIAVVDDGAGGCASSGGASAGPA
ncbi:MAG: hypothetical protein FJ265_06370 [Planctomycetes bacterium]|nr:hypothetical protein [Planctomycetota bacterium]